MKRMKTCQLLGLLTVCVGSPMSAKAASTGLPQLDISTWPSQLFWLVVLFTVGYILMAKVVTPQIGKALEERRAKLDGDLCKARTATEDVARIRAEYEANLDVARSAAAETVKRAAVDAANRAEAGDAKIAKKLAEKIAKAEAKLATLRGEVMSNLNDVAAEAAMAAVVQLTDIKTTAAQASKIANRVSSNQAKQEAD